MQTLTAGQAIVKVLEAEGVRFVFGLPGGHILQVYDGLYRSNRIRHILARHEHAAACMASAHFQLTGEPGIVTVTAGPGCTNLLTGIAEAFVGAIPIIILAARSGTNVWQKGAAQEVATDQIFAPVTKWAVRIDRADLLVPAVRKAFAVARSGKPGPVLIDIPRDLLGEQVPFDDYIPVGKPAALRPEPEKVKQAVAALLSAKRPIIVAGGGAVAADAQAELRAVVELLAAPVLTSLAGRGSISDDHPLSAGGLGCHRNDLTKKLLGEADVVLGLGTRFEEMENNWRPGFIPAPDATYIQVDIDPEEIGRSIVPRIGIVGDVKAVLAEMVPLLRESGKTVDADELATHPRVVESLRERARMEAEADEIATVRSSPIHAVAVIRASQRVFPRDTVVSIDVGCLAQHMGGVFPLFKLPEPRSAIVCSSFYGMGFATCGLPVAKLIYPDRPAIGFVGDGSFQMVMHILPVAVEHRLPVTWCILDDEALGSIYDIQKYAYGDRILGTTFPNQPDFAKIADACGCFGETVTALDGVEDALRHALAANQRGQPAVLDFKCGKDRLRNTLEYYTIYPAGL